MCLSLASVSTFSYHPFLASSMILAADDQVGLATTVSTAARATVMVAEGRGVDVAVNMGVVASETPYAPQASIHVGRPFRCAVAATVVEDSGTSMCLSLASVPNLSDQPCFVSSTMCAADVRPLTFDAGFLAARVGGFAGTILTPGLVCHAPFASSLMRAMVSESSTQVRAEVACMCHKLGDAGERTYATAVSTPWMSIAVMGHGNILSTSPTRVHFRAIADPDDE